MKHGNIKMENIKQKYKKQVTVKYSYKARNERGNEGYGSLSDRGYMKENGKT